MLLAHLSVHLFIKVSCCQELPSYMTCTQLSALPVLSNPDGTAGGIV